MNMNLIKFLKKAKPYYFLNFIKNFLNFNKLSRIRSWMRKVYVEELYEIS